MGFIFVIMSILGLEPRTHGLKGRCSTIELYTHLMINLLKCLRTGLNCRPLGFQPNALPLSYLSLFKVFRFYCYALFIN